MPDNEEHKPMYYFIKNQDYEGGVRYVNAANKENQKLKEENQNLKEENQNLKELNQILIKQIAELRIVSSYK